jgi:hypothetical protein
VSKEIKAAVSELEAIADMAAKAAKGVKTVIDLATRAAAVGLI